MNEREAKLAARAARASGLPFYLGQELKVVAVSRHSIVVEYLAGPFPSTARLEVCHDDQEER